MEEKVAQYRGEFTKLKTIVSELGYRGDWTDDDNKKAFRSEDDAILNWWPSTGTIQCQGPADAKTKLEAAISDALSDSIPYYSGDVDSKRVFVVYGHDITAREQLELVLRRLNLEPFVLANTSGDGLTIIEALENEMLSSPTGKRFGVVLLTPDDVGYKRESGPDAAEPRSRQNVVMEMGMLLAAFGRSKVAILKKGNVVMPSDTDGILFTPFESHVREAVRSLCERLNDAGFELSTDAVLEALA